MPRILFTVLLMAQQASAQPAARYELLITEIFADPAPSYGLPAAEYVEVRNVSRRTIDLDRFSISDGTTSGYITGSQPLAPDSMLLLCTRSAQATLSAFGRAVGVSSLPSLDNEGDLLALRSAEGATIHAVRYASDWYGNTLKAAGGWSLEMIDLRSPCMGRENWTASSSPVGGTPGRQNSVAGARKDTTAPFMTGASWVDSLSFILRLSEPVDSLSAAATGGYRFDGGLGPAQSASPLPPLFDAVRIRLPRTPAPQQVYRVEAAGLRDCAGNAPPAGTSVRVGRPSALSTGQVRINEVLFDARAEGSEFVEILNRGPGIADLSELHIAIRGSEAQTLQPRRLSDASWLFFPGDHLAVTNDGERLLAFHARADPAQVLEMPQLAPMPDEKGIITLMDNRGEVTDAFAYAVGMHFPLLSSRDGVSLERIDPAGRTTEVANWHSAASTAGYATPTERNSQYRNGDTLAGTLTVEPATFSPDMDGIDDHLQVAYSFPEPGYTCAIALLDGYGRIVARLARNDLCGTAGRYRWDGLDAHGRRLPSGPYCLVMEVADLKGRSRVIRRNLVLAYRW